MKYYKNEKKAFKEDGNNEEKNKTKK